MNRAWFACASMLWFAAISAAVGGACACMTSAGIGRARTPSALPGWSGWTKFIGCGRLGCMARICDWIRSCEIESLPVSMSRSTPS